LVYAFEDKPVIDTDLTDSILLFCNFKMHIII